MADVEGLDDDRDTALPTSALSPAEYRSFRTLVAEVKGVNSQSSLYSVLEFLTTFNAVSQGVAQQVVNVVLGPEQGEFVGDGHVYAMIRLVGHWQTDGRIEKWMIFVQARVPERSGSKSSSSSSHDHSATPSLAPTSTTLNPFRANSTPSASSSTARPAGVDRGVEAFKRLMFAKSKEGSQSDTATTTEPTEGSVRSLPPPTVKLEDSASLYSTRTDQSHTGMTFVYTSDEEDDFGSSVKHSPETQLRESPQPIVPTTPDRRSLPPLSIPQSSPQKPAPPPSRKRGASGSNQVSIPVEADNKTKLEEKLGTAKRNLPPAPPAPRRTLSSASTPQSRPERSSSIRQPALPPPTSLDTTKPAPPRSRRKLSDTSVTSFDIQQPRLSSESQRQQQQQPDPPPIASSASPAANKRISVQAPPPPPPPRGRKHDLPPSSPTSRRSTDLPTRLGLERPESPRRASAPDHEKPKILELQDSELSLELGRLQREVDELVYGLTKKRGGTSGS